MTRRILLLITDLEVGGTPTVVRELARRLSARGRAHIHVACLAGNGPVAEEIQRFGVAVTALNARGATDVAVIARLAGLIRRERFDTVFSFLVHANVAASIARLFCPGVSFLQAIHTAQTRPRWHWWIMAVAQFAAERIVVPSASVAAALRDRSRVSIGKILVIPNAIEPSDFPLSLVSQEDPRPYPIGFIGRFDPVKRIPDLIEAVASLRGLVHLHIFGYGRDQSAIETAIMRHNVRNGVTLHGRISSPAEALRRMGCLVLPSEAEGFGLVLIEAMAAGVPVVARDVSGIRDVIENGNNGLLAHGPSPQAMAVAIADIVSDRGLRARLIARGIASVAASYTWEAVLPRYLDLLKIRTGSVHERP